MLVVFFFLVVLGVLLYALAFLDCDIPICASPCSWNYTCMSQGPATD
jgi:hypothetical protein